MPVSIDREIARIRGLPGQNWHALALQTLQDYINSLQAPATPAAATPAKTTAIGLSGGGASSPSTPPFVLSVNGVTVAHDAANLNNMLPTAPGTGLLGVLWQVDNTLPRPNVSAWIVAPKQLVSAVVGKPAVSATVLIYTLPFPATIPANCAGSVGSVGANPTAPATYIILQNGNPVGTVVISALGVFTFTTTGGNPVSLAIGDRVTMTAPNPQDLTLSDVEITLLAD